MDLKCRRQQKLHSVDENKLVGTIRVEGISPVVISLGLGASSLLVRVRGKFWRLSKRKSDPQNFPSLLPLGEGQFCWLAVKSGYFFPRKVKC